MRKSLNDGCPTRAPAVFAIQNGLVRGKRILRAWRDPGGRVWMATERLRSGEYFGCVVWLEVSWTCYWRDDITHPRDGMVELPADKVVLVSNFVVASNAADDSDCKQADGSRDAGDGAMQDTGSATVVVRNGEINGKRIIRGWAASEAPIRFLATECDEEKYYGYFVALEEMWGPVEPSGLGHRSLPPLGSWQPCASACDQSGGVSVCWARGGG